jgi:hypothetical protein
MQIYSETLIVLVGVMLTVYFIVNFVSVCVRVSVYGVLHKRFVLLD